MGKIKLENYVYRIPRKKLLTIRKSVTNVKVFIGVSKG